LNNDYALAGRTDNGKMVPAPSFSYKTGMAGAWYGPGHNEKWVEDAEPTPLIAMPWLEFHIKSARP